MTILCRLLLLYVCYRRGERNEFRVYLIPCRTLFLDIITTHYLLYFFACSSSPTAGCMDNNYSAFIAQMRNIVPDPNARGVPLRTWNWQYCSAFAYYQGPYTLFLHLTLMTLESNFQICVDAFGERVAAPVNIEAVAQTNALLGGKRAAVAASRILFVNSGIDGWSAAGVRPGDPVDPSNAVVFMPTQSHCRAMSGSRADDPPEVKKARDDSAAVLATWLAV